MLQKFKKMIPLVAMVLLFSSTIAYADDYDIDAYMNPSMQVYSAICEKSIDSSSAVVYSTGTPRECCVRYTVVNSAGYQKSASKKVNIISTTSLSYEGYNVQIGDDIKLRAQNNTVDNTGRFITVKADWIP